MSIAHIDGGVEVVQQQCMSKVGAGGSQVRGRGVVDRAQSERAGGPSMALFEQLGRLSLRWAVYDMVLRSMGAVNIDA
jgi:hypothetical protein